MVTPSVRVGVEVVVTPAPPAVVVVVAPVTAVVVVVAPVTAVVVVVAVALVVVVVEAGGGASEHVGTVIVFVSIVTAPFRASARPVMVALVSRVIDVVAMIVPAKLVVVPSVAELPTCQNTLQAWAPFSRATVLDVAVVSVVPAWKIHTVFGSPPPLRVTVPVRPMEDAD